MTACIRDVYGTLLAILEPGRQIMSRVGSWHNSLNRRVKNSHVNVYEMIRHLKNDERDFRYQRALRSAGNPPQPMNKRYRKLNERFIRLAADYDAHRIQLSDYVTQVGYSLHNPETNEVSKIPQDENLFPQHLSTSKPRDSLVSGKSIF